MIVIVDFGGQTAHLIARRLRDLGSPCQIAVPKDALSLISSIQAQGIVLSGGPSSVYEKGAPTISKTIFSLGIPILGICYGFQLSVKLLGGKVIAGRSEYGPAEITMKRHYSQLTKNVPNKFTIWMSHGDTITSLPKDFLVVGSTKSVLFAAAISEKRKLYMLQFHPEIEHTDYGNQLLKNFISICGVKKVTHTIDPKLIITSIKKIVNQKYVIGAVSGGVDSTVAGTLVAKAIGDKFIPIFVNNGLMRNDAIDTVAQIFKTFNIVPIIVNVEKEMLKRLKGVTDSEQKRKIIGAFYIEVFEKEMDTLLKNHHDVAFLLQGTIYSDVIESKGSLHASKIKSHHNAGGLPKNMRLTLLEPLRDLYKDQVRQLGKKLSLPDEFVNKQVFPGPGYAVRIRGEVTADRLKRIKIADDIVLSELKKAKILENVYMSFPVMTGAFSTAVKGDGRFYGEVIALRIIESKDVMSTVWTKVPYEVLQQISSRIVNEVPDISRVVYDITTKPPATMEWE